jgi:hypothetical protein
MKRVVVGALAVSLISAVLVVAPAATSQAIDGTDFKFYSVAGDLPYAMNQEFSQADLAQVGLGEYELAGAPSAEAPLAEAPIQEVPSNAEVSPQEAADIGIQYIPAPDGTYNVLSTFYDRQGRSMLIRRGWSDGAGGGFGYTKVVNYHNLSLRAVQAVARNYFSAPSSGTKRTYNANVNYVTCYTRLGLRYCKITKTTVVIMPVDFRYLSDGKSFGVVTAYCTGYYPRCPDWVKNAANA